MHRDMGFLRRRRIYLTLAAFFLVLFTPSLLPSIIQFGDHIRQILPFAYQWKVQQDFVPTQDELDCLYGRAAGPETASHAKIEPIPNHVHFIYGLSNPFNKPSAGTFDFLCYLAIRSAIVGMKADKISLHYTYLADPPSPEPNASPLSNPWIRRLKDDIELVYHSPEEMAALKSSPGATWQAAHVSDILRLRLLQREGGIYLDMDAFGFRPFTDLLKSPRDIILGHEGGNRGGLCNAIMVARKNSSFVERWLKEYEGADLSKEWNYHSVVLPKELQLQHRDEVCALPPDAFFWPTWTWDHIEFMHKRLSMDEARRWSAEIDKNGGSLYEDQVAYHAWSQMAWDRHLKKLTPEIVRTHDTRFNLLVRNFMQDDL
ncbi:glycosyltransferase family 32 protein [Durotheca rogersii]|uniref:glycosyltransferase family 32 protein n=1 Tax=Durotheca rogersii TaxID=419775 RepID=UPI00221E859B|nr:glycosyltransferase family 32 protein [Durotheca rogersii]KAI5865292.1 glycosyltransferase family 32 protein [Durotheca rogersii]